MQDISGKRPTAYQSPNHGRFRGRALSRFAGTLATFAITAALSSAGHAQSGQAAGDSGRLDEIVVTAQKRTQNIQQVGITMQAVTSDQLVKANILQAAQLANVVPGLNVAGAAGGQVVLFGIRGVVQQDFVGSAESPVAVYIDDGYVAANSISSVGLLDVDHVEVLKGPQGTLFGRNATGGIVNIFTKKPTDSYQGYARATGGSHSTLRFEGAVGGPLSDVLSFRVAGVYNRNGAWIKNTSPLGGDLGGEHGFALRAHLEYDPKTNFTALLTVHASRTWTSWGPYFAASVRQVFDAGNNVIDSVAVAGPTGLGTPASDPKHLTMESAQAQSHHGLGNSMTGATAKLTWDVGPQIVSITDYKKTTNHNFVDDDSTSFLLIDTNNNDFADNFSQEIRIFRDKGEFRWYGGLYYLHIKSGVNPQRNWIYVGNVRADDLATLRTDSYSAFGQLEYDFAPKFTIVAGFRATKEVKDYDYSSTLYTLGGSLIGPARTPFSGHSNKMLYSGKAQIEFHPSRDLMFYAGYNRGTKAGSFNVPFAGGTAYPDSAIPYRSETLHAFEIGQKATLFDGAARFNSAIFYYDYQNYQAFNLIGLSTQVTNRDARTYGGEVDFEAKPAPHFAVQLSGSYTNNKVYDVDLGGPSLVTRIAPYTSKWKGSAQARYDFDIGTGNVALTAGADYTGTFWYSLTNYTSTRVPGHVVGRASIGWTDERDLWSLVFDVQNITDKRYKTVGFDLSGICGCSVEAYGRPRWYSLTLGRKF
ncbi:hypothetical protein ASE00_07845 [Sphingomonas sp. Root710]|uniref:TonB-dependent receptor n=1 Tax=Sphingomonas sp. Root710 TaxID=1736594 RepID=UPI0007145A73|nr:TonB-dependent receptor [Sphingomonas sp. Root710]KRB86591.1 hypothetical protein ASE00_07845 [Sphingomonas sp. Root710]